MCSSYQSDSKEPFKYHPTGDLVIVCVCIYTPDVSPILHIVSHLLCVCDLELDEGATEVEQIDPPLCLFTTLTDGRV